MASRCRSCDEISRRRGGKRGKVEILEEDEDRAWKNRDPFASIIEASDSLENPRWRMIQSADVPDGALTFVDPTAWTSTRFYRLRTE
jgi:hypothetical protein